MTVLIAIAAFFPLLAVLVVIHELGHFLTARAFGVKVLEFGFGYPPRLLGIRTGRTHVLVDSLTKFTGTAEIGGIRVGTFVKLGVVENAASMPGAKELVARTVEVGGARPAAGQENPGRERPDDLKIEGVVRAVEGDTLVVADMLYSLNLLPLGGFVRLAGENNPRVPRSLAGTTPGRRIIVLAAGAFMNAVLAIALFSVVFMVPQKVDVGDVTVTVVEPDSPAAEAGVQPGDVFVRAGGSSIETVVELRRAVELKLGGEMEWELLRGDQPHVVTLEPRWSQPEGQGPTGVQVRLDNSTTVTRSDPPWRAVPRSFTTTRDMLVLLKNEVTRWFVAGERPQFTGPVGIAQVTGEVAEQGDILLFLTFAAFLSVNLAILNILPIPMLDGGRLVFVVLEWVRRGKRVSPEKEGMVHLIGFVLLISAVVAITYSDIARIIQGDRLLG